MRETVDNIDLQYYFQLLEKDSAITKKGLPSTSDLFLGKSDLFLKIFLKNNSLVSDSLLEKTEVLSNLTGNGRNSLELESKKLFIQSIRHLLISVVFKNWNRKYHQGLLADSTNLIPLIKDSLNEILLLSVTFKYDEYSISSLLSSIYPSPDKLGKKDEKEFLTSVIKTYHEVNETKHFGWVISDFVTNLEVTSSVSKDILLKLLVDLLNIFLYRSRNCEIYEMFCVLAEGDDSAVLISSLEIFHSQDKNSRSNNEFDNSQLLITCFDNVPDIKNTQSEDMIRENFKKVLDYIIKRSPNLKGELLSNKYLFTLKSTGLMNSKSQIDGNSLNLPFMLLLITSKLFMTPITLESGICATGNLIITPDSSTETIRIGSVKGAADKIQAIKKYNQYQLFDPVKALFVPEQDLINFKTEMKNNDIDLVTSYEEVANCNQLYLKGARDLLEIDIIDPFINYLKDKSLLFENLLKEDSLEKIFNSEYESIKDFQNYISLFIEKELTLNERLHLLLDNSGDYCLLDNEGIIIPSFAGQNPFKNAELFCSFLAWQRLKLQFTRIPVPVLLPVYQISKYEEVSSYLFSLFAPFNIQENIAQMYLHSRNSYVFIAYDENIEKLENPFHGENLISKLISYHFVVACANSIEQANFWNEKVSISSRV